MQSNNYHPWPALPYEQFRSTAHLLHMCSQVIGKLKLHTPFEPHWSNVALWLTSRGLTTGPIPYHQAIFSIDLDLITHEVIISTSWAANETFSLNSMSVAKLTQNIFDLLHKLDINLTINFLPQEVPNPIPFDRNLKEKFYDASLANAWWHILISSYQVMMKYHAKFNGETPPIGLMWGTFDLRDARYNGIAAKITDQNSDYIRRNAMDEGQIEIGFWPGNDTYSQPAYFSFTFPQPEQIEQASIKPSKASWNNDLSEFVVDYEDIRTAKNPEQDLLDFFESTFEVGSRLANWKNFLKTGTPI